ncbi:hypothetical protein FGO68_gene6283 [Halteria grandinella]|uniref:Uncharacterized protein n=1 Tax=Halteria grandinella TaxID=5974 RepID=A0A8J8NYI8_HALGN|nr:hypothetical protein FGO68_gene6283 [Halteria grandinella]
MQALQDLNIDQHNGHQRLVHSLGTVSVGGHNCVIEIAASVQCLNLSGHNGKISAVPLNGATVVEVGRMILDGHNHVITGPFKVQQYMDIRGHNIQVEDIIVVGETSISGHNCKLNRVQAGKPIQNNGHNATMTNISAYVAPVPPQNPGIAAMARIATLSSSSSNAPSNDGQPQNRMH